MQAIILAAGKSTRTYPLTVTKPKPLLKIANKTILEHNLEQLALVKEINEVIIIIGYQKEQIIDVIVNKYQNEYKRNDFGKHAENFKIKNKIKLRYFEQKEQLGTGHALMQVKDALHDRFIVMNGDDLFSGKDIAAAIKHRYAVLGAKVKEPSRFGIIVSHKKDDKNLVKEIVEKPKSFVGNIANTGLYVFDKKIFDFKLKKSSRGEFEIIDYVNFLIEKEGVYAETVSDYWFSIGYPWDLLEANEFFVGKVTEGVNKSNGSASKNKINCEKEENVTIKGNILVGKGTRLLSGTYIEGNVVIGENCKIGPNCYLRGSTSIGNNCHIGQAVEIKNSIIGDNSKIPHLSYIGDSVVGDGVNFGAGTITANLRHDNANIKSIVKDELVDSGRRKLGVIIADNVHTGIHTTLYPGRKLWPGTSTLPGEIVKKDKLS
ncbi:TPA: NTP transferase domain-containing protein [Candidatus Woesearchaeota archaeon]|nr:NTP transferase domain-containing protein [Candidatus Woesearchaeota archaeon]